MTSDDARECGTCGAAADLHRHAGREVQVGTVAVAIDAIPRWRCDRGHEVAALTREAVEDALDRIEVALPHARRRLLRGREDCTVCGGSLTMPARRTAWPVTVDHPDGLPAVLTLHLDVPATRCPACGTDHVPTRSHADLEAAVRAVLADEP